MWRDDLCVNLTSASSSVLAQALIDYLYNQHWPLCPGRNISEEGDEGTDPRAGGDHQMYQAQS